MFQEVVDFITPHVTQQNERQSLMINAFNNEPQLLNQITYEGSAAVFVPSLVQRLRLYGKLKNGNQALWQILLTLKNQVGLDGERTIESFREWANAPTSTKLESSSDQGSPTPSFKEVKRKQFQAALKLKIEEYESVSEALMTSLDPGQSVKLQRMIERLDTEIQGLEQKITELS